MSSSFHNSILKAQLIYEVQTERMGNISYVGDAPAPEKTNPSSSLRHAAIYFDK